MFERVISFVGEDNFLKIQNTTVLVVGLGGVGGYAVESLVRTGIQNIVIIDYDKIDKSNLNRQIVTNTNNIGSLKVKEFEKRIKDINPDCQVTGLNLFLNDKNISILNDFKVDYIIDACDTVETKEILIDYSIENNIKLISCMGTANKIDPLKLKITDISKTSYDPLAKVIRKYVSTKYHNQKLLVVSTDEEPINRKDLTSLIFVPATAGLLCSNYIIKDIIKKKE